MGPADLGDVATGRSSIRGGVCCPQELVGVSRGQEIVVIKALAAVQEVGEVEQQQQQQQQQEQEQRHHQAAATGDGTSARPSPLSSDFHGGRGVGGSGAGRLWGGDCGGAAGWAFPNGYEGVPCGSAEETCDRYFEALLQPLEFRRLPMPQIAATSLHAAHPHLHHPYRQEQRPLRRGERSAGRDLAFQGAPRGQAVSQAEPTVPPVDELHRLALCS